MTPTVVLVVDDDARNRKLVCDVIRHAGLEALEAATGRHAVTMARTHVPGVILMDLRLPDLDGSAALALLQAEPETASIPVVALTAIAGAADALLAAGFAGYIEKPIDVRELAAQVRAYCAAR
ncbi:MAG TPA: response regulator [Gaiellaceae bacterium]|nr:response regulator [Gaiellaceae bacterium]